MNPERCAEIVRRLKSKIANALDQMFLDNSVIQANNNGLLTITVEGQTFRVVLLPIAD